jgi:hypothetical protein
MTKITFISSKLIIIFILLALLTPFIINCFFAYPQTDDFCYSVLARNLGFFKTQYYVYKTWSGRFTSTALLSINPLVYGSFIGYKLVFAFLITTQIASIYLLTCTITKQLFSCQEKLIFVLMLTVAYLDRMDDVRSGLYWMAGVITYQVAATLFILFISLMFIINEDKTHDKFLHKCAAILIGIILGGTNEIVMVLAILITSFGIFYSYIVNKSIKPIHIATYVALIAGSCLGIMAPGNFARLSVYHTRKDLYVTFLSSFYSVMTHIGIWITYPLTLLLMFMVFYVVIKNPKFKYLFGNFNILSSVSLWLGFTYMCFFIPYWCTGMPPENRVLNMIYLFFLIGWIIILTIVFSYYGECLLTFIKMIPNKVGYIIVPIYMIMLFSFGTSNFALVTKDLLSGGSFRYNAEMQQRESQMKNAEQKSVKFENISNTPESLYFYFIGPDENNWVNSCYAAYFGNKSVVLSNNKKCRN